MSKEYIGGHVYAIAEVLDFQAVPVPPLAPAGYARLYYNRGADKLRISRDGGAWFDFDKTQISSDELTTEDGNTLTTEDGDELSTE